MARKSSKGSQFERDICKLLSLWWSNQERDDIFWRTAGSGARATTRRKKGKSTADSAADMMATHISGKPLTKTCIFEMKRGFSDSHKIVKHKETGNLGIKKVRHGLEVLTILDKLESSKDPILIEWWSKLEKERRQTRRRYSFIIFRRDSKQACIAMSYKTFNFTIKRNGKFNGIIIGIHFPVEKKLESLVILKLSDFLEWCKPVCFMDLPRQIRRREKRQIKRRKKK